MMCGNGLRLTIELIPSQAWFQSLHNYYSESGQSAKWRKIKEEIFAKEGKKCFICERSDVRLEAHEFWEYDDITHVQKLVSIHHLCGLCHKVKHIGFWCYTDDGAELLRKMNLSRDDLGEHFCEVNSCTGKIFEEHLLESFETWEKRKKYEWTQELGDYNINP